MDLHLTVIAPDIHLGKPDILVFVIILISIDLCNKSLHKRPPCIYYVLSYSENILFIPTIIRFCTWQFFPYGAIIIAKKNGAIT